MITSTTDSTTGRASERRSVGLARIVDDCRLDLQHAARSLRRSPGYAVVTMLTLALGIGSNTALFSMLHNLVLRALPYRDGDRLVRIASYSTQRKNNAIFSDYEVSEFASQVRSIENTSEFHHLRFTFSARRDTDVVETGVVSANYFDLFGIRPLYGRVFAKGEDRAGAAPVLVLGYHYFVSAFDADPSVLGQTVRLNDQLHTVIGVLAPIPDYPQRIDVFIPISSCPVRTRAAFRNNPSMRMMTVFGHLKAGATWEQASAELQTLSRQLRAAHPEAYPQHEQWGIRANSVREEITSQAAPTFRLLFGATALVLLIACANVANLVVARTLKRGREMALREALGARRERILRQLLVEGLMIAVPGAIIGLLLTWPSMRLLSMLAVRLSPRAQEVTINAPVLLFMAAVAILTGVLACALPAWRRPIDLVPQLKEGAAATSGVPRRRLRGALIAAQVAFSLVLVLGAGLLFRSFVNLLRVDPGFRPARVLVMQISPNYRRLNGGIDDFRKVFESVVERIRSSPGVVSAVVSSRLPLDHQPPVQQDISIENQSTLESRQLVDVVVTSPGYFATLGMTILSGRDFSDSDRAGAPQVAIIGKAMAMQSFPGQDPLGRRISFDHGASWIRVVGTVGNLHLFAVDQKPGEAVYLPFGQFPMGTNIMVRTSADAASVIPAVRAAVHAADPDRALASVKGLDTILDESLAAPRLTATLLGLFAALTLLVTITGISGAAALGVGERRIEIGVRLAIGARPIQVIGLIVRREMTMVCAGLIVGLMVTFALARVLRAFLFQTAPSDAATFAVMTLLIAIVAACACFLPARRAAVVPLSLSLRSE